MTTERPDVLWARNILEEGLEFGRRVLAGEQPANKWVRLAVEEFFARFEDVEEGRRTDIRFDREAVVKVIRFCRLCRHIKGPLARKTWLNPATGKKERHRFEPRPWQALVLADMFGWVYSDSGFRLRSYLYMEVGRKNGKSYFAAVIMLYLLLADGEPGAEIYSIANSMDQTASARGIFGVARKIVLRSPSLRKRVQVKKFELEYEKQDAVWVPWSSEEGDKDGGNASGFVADEVHKFKTGSNWEDLAESMIARDQPASISVTTSGWDRESFCGELRESGEALLDPENPYENEAWAFWMFGVDEDDAWDDPAIWIKANPNLEAGGPTLRYLRSKVKECRQTPSKIPIFERKHLTRWSAPVEICPFDLQKLKRCNTAIDFEALAGERCVAAFDLSSTTDTTALAALFPDRISHPVDVLLIWCWLPEDNLEARQRRDKGAYEAWTQDGPEWCPTWLSLSDGDTIDYQDVEDVIFDLKKRFALAEVVFDNRFASGLERRLADEGITMRKQDQTSWGMHAGFSELIRKIRLEEMTHGDNPLFRWSCSQTVRDENDNGLSRPKKRRKSSRIDPVHAACMAYDGAMKLPRRVRSRRIRRRKVPKRGYSDLMD